MELLTLAKDAVTLATSHPVTKGSLTGAADRDRSDLARMAVELSRDRLREEMAKTDGDDLKALGYLAANGAAAVGLFVGQGYFKFWWISATGYLFSALLALFAAQRSDYPEGPDGLAVYVDQSSVPHFKTMQRIRQAAEQVSRSREGWRRRSRNLSLLLTLAITFGTVIWVAQLDWSTWMKW